MFFWYLFSGLAKIACLLNARILHMTRSLTFFDRNLVVMHYGDLSEINGRMFLR